MGTPVDHLPKPICEDAINNLLQSVGFPRAIEITSPQVTAQYHSIYKITVPPNESTHTQLILRVSGRHLPNIKTENEVAVMAWITTNTSLPIPYVVACDSSDLNPISHEYTLLSHVGGSILSDIYQDLDDQQISHIIDQLADILIQLHAHEWKAIGGLKLEKDCTIAVSRVVDETFWHLPDIERLWPKGESVDSLNIEGPFPTYIDLVSAQVQKYIYLIQTHDKLASMRDMVPKLTTFIEALPRYSDELNNVQLRLAHKDLHFANILYDVPSGKITSILDWEFSGVVPFTKWNPRKAFLWNGQDNEKNGQEKERLLELFTSRCEERNITILEDAEYSSSLQQSMQKVVDFLRAITECMPRAQKEELIPGWRSTVLENIAPFEG